MHRILTGSVLCAVLIVAVPINSWAQTLSPRGEIFGGYSYIRADSFSPFNTSGWEASATGNFNRFLGLEVDLSDHFNSPPVTSNAHSNEFSFLFGPHFAFRAIPRVNPFVHFLVGGTRGTVSSALAFACPAVCAVGQPCPPPCTPSSFTQQTQTVVTTAVGGGVDVKAARFAWIRVIQADYLREPFSGDTQNNLRVSFGVVLRFGR